MAECVSCGRKIPAGKLFCGDCYKKMKGRKGALKDVSRYTADRPPFDAVGGSRATAGETRREASENPPPQLAPEIAKKARGKLTPTSSKKVISMKPEIDKAASGKAKGGRKRFTITITFSDRAYAALARLKVKKKTEVKAAPSEGGTVTDKPVGGHKTARRSGPHGRPMLKAVGEASTIGKRGNFFVRTMAYRDRQWDFGDQAAALMSTAATVLVLVLSFLGWIRLSWLDGTGSEQMIDISGMDLGFPVYFIVALAFISWLYMTLTRILKRPLLNLDYGVVLLVVGFLIIVIFYITISSSGLVTGAADRALGKSGGYFQRTIEGYEQQNIWPAYAMVVMGCLIAFSGLVRLADRRTAKASG